MRNVRRRLDVLERLPQFQPPPSQLDQIGSRAAAQLSNEELDLMIHMLKRDGGECRPQSPSELAAMATHAAARDTEAQRMGFKSYADAKRRAARRATGAAPPSPRPARPGKRKTPRRKRQAEMPRVASRRKKKKNRRADGAADPQ